MDHNQICNIRGAPFNHLPRLRVLSLRNNRMTTVTEFAFQKLRTNVVVLDIDGNPLSCSCKMLWLIGWLEDTQSEGPRCADGTLFRDARLSRSECGHSRVIEPVIPGCESDTVQSSVVETAQLTALTSNLRNATQGLLPHETEYFYDEYVEYQYEEVNSTDKPVHASSTSEAPVTTQKSYHFTSGDTPTLYARPAPPKFNLTNPGLGLDDLKKAQQNQQPYNGITFFGIPLPSLSFGNLWKGNSGRSVEQSPNRSAFAVGKVQPVSKKFEGKNFQNFVKPQTEGGFMPVIPNKNGFPAETSLNPGVVTPVQKQIITKELNEQDKFKPAESSSEPYIAKLHLNTEVIVPGENSSILEVATLHPWPKLPAEESKQEYPTWGTPTTETSTPFIITDEVFKVEQVSPQGENNWYFENYNKTNLEPYIGVNKGCKIVISATVYLFWWVTVLLVR